MSIRCFIAIELAESIQKKLARLADQLAQKIGIDNNTIKWVDPQRIHLTLKFLGNVDDNEIVDISQALSQAALDFEPFELEFGDLGCFPSGGSARVLWIGIKDGQYELTALQESVEELLEILDFPPENRKFNGHLTLARIKSSPTGRAVRQVVEDSEPITLGRQDVTHITLFQSDLTRTGPIYTAMHTAQLRNS